MTQCLFSGGGEENLLLTFYKQYKTTTVGIRKPTGSLGITPQPQHSEVAPSRASQSCQNEEAKIRVRALEVARIPEGGHRSGVCIGPRYPVSSRVAAARLKVQSSYQR